MKIRLEEADLFHAGGLVDGQTDRRKERHDAANGRLYAILRTRQRNCVYLNVNSRMHTPDVEVHVFLTRIRLRRRLFRVTLEILHTVL
jgi:hypothetical protein